MTFQLCIGGLGGFLSRSFERNQQDYKRAVLKTSFVVINVANRWLITAHLKCEAVKGRIRTFFPGLEKGRETFAEKM